MNNFKSIDFNAGCIYYDVERKLFKLHKQGHRLDKVDIVVTIPKIQMLPKGTRIEDIHTVVDNTCKIVKTQFEDVYGKLFELNYDPNQFTSLVGRQYLDIHCLIIRKQSEEK